MTTEVPMLSKEIQERLVVQKYGGSSVANPDRIKVVAGNIAATVKNGHNVVVVVSAMGDTTDELVALAHSVSERPAAREMDMLLTSGERISAALLCMALHDEGIDSISFAGSQAGIHTDTSHGRAKIEKIEPYRLVEALEEGKVCVVAGFQGVSEISKDITTLGRGGSDTTAVALAAALKATSCDIYTDVDGVYSADPRIVKQAKKLEHVRFNEMLEMAATGGRVLALRAVEFARTHKVTLRVRSSFNLNDPGTEISNRENKMEKAVVTAVTHDVSEVKFTLTDVPDKPGVAGRVFRAIASANLGVDMIIQNISEGGVTDISFTLPAEDAQKAADVLEEARNSGDQFSFACDKNVGRISLIGAGMKTSTGIAATTFETLAAQDINILMISTSSIRISCVVARADVERGVQALHSVFGLDQERDAQIEFSKA